MLNVAAFRQETVANGKEIVCENYVVFPCDLRSNLLALSKELAMLNAMGLTFE